MSNCGTFVSLDGPGGAGKSTIAALVCGQLAAAGQRVRATAEPSPTPLGEMIRASTDIYRGMTLACLSLVLQRMDGVDWDTIWQLNTGAEPPDLAVILNAAPAVLARRLTSRGGTHSRFERLPDGPAAESALYHDTAARLIALGWPVCAIDSTARAPGDVAAIVTDRILTLHADRSAHGNQRPVIPDIQHR